MKILVVNGPNLNMLGVREVSIYGTKTYAELTDVVENCARQNNIECEVFQSNHEGAIVERIQNALHDETTAIVINAAAYTHTSIAILDALKAVGLPAIEVHLTDPIMRESFRHLSYVGMACEKTIVGKGFEGYNEAIEYLCKKYK